MAGRWPWLVAFHLAALNHTLGRTEVELRVPFQRPGICALGNDWQNSQGIKQKRSHEVPFSNSNSVIFTSAMSQPEFRSASLLEILEYRGQQTVIIIWGFPCMGVPQ